MAETAIPLLTVTEKEIKISKIPGARIEPERLNGALLTLSANEYLGLFREMYAKIYGYPPLVNLGGYCGTLGDTEESNV